MGIEYWGMLPCCPGVILTINAHIDGETGVELGR